MGFLKKVDKALEKVEDKIEHLEEELDGEHQHEDHSMHMIDPEHMIHTRDSIWLGLIDMFVVLGLITAWRDYFRGTPLGWSLLALAGVIIIWGIALIRSKNHEVRLIGQVMTLINACILVMVVALG